MVSPIKITQQRVKRIFFFTISGNYFVVDILFLPVVDQRDHYRDNIYVHLCKAYNKALNVWQYGSMGFVNDSGNTSDSLVYFYRQKKQHLILLSRNFRYML